MTSLAPIPATPVAIRPATMDDLPFMDRLQKMHSKQLGYFPTKQFEEYVEQGAVLIAHVGARPASRSTRSVESIPAAPDRDAGVAPTEQRLGYVIAKDRYLKRDELGVIYQLCVTPGEQRKLVGAALIQSVFERSAYGCRLYCCWCAQDLAANHFWESLGFLPIAFRAGSRGKKRVHIFWQRRIVEGDETPWWFPFQTNSGAIREDRLVFPIPPGTHWSEVQAVVVPTENRVSGVGDRVSGEEAEKKGRPRGSPATGKSQRATICSGGLRFASAAPAAETRTRARRAKAPPAKIDPEYLAAARELRDRYLEQVNRGPALAAAQGKYDVCRRLGAGAAPIPLLPAA